MRSILLLPLVARCLETIDVCKWRVIFVVFFTRKNLLNKNSTKKKEQTKLL